MSDGASAATLDKRSGRATQTLKDGTDTRVTNLTKIMAIPPKIEPMQ
jgi:hypothetical protein